MRNIFAEQVPAPVWAWPVLTLYTSHPQMKHHHVFIIKHSHSHIATHEEDVSSLEWSAPPLTSPKTVVTKIQDLSKSSSQCLKQNLTFDFLITF